MNSYHSEADIQKDINTFLTTNASKLLNTSAASYFTFLDFYCKTQSGQQYAPVPMEE
jgi:hypothetical protein